MIKKFREAAVLCLLLTDVEVRRKVEAPVRLGRLRTKAEAQG